MPTSANLAFLISRLVGGLTLAAHGAQKLLGWFAGPGPAKLAQGFRAQGLRPCAALDGPGAPWVSSAADFRSRSAC